MTKHPVSICAICGLLCADDRQAESNSVHSCGRRVAWFHQHRPATSQAALGCGTNIPLESVCAQIDRVLTTAKRPLIWIDGADVQTMRAAVLLAQKHFGTIHVAQSSGQSAVQRVMTGDGWFGTTLADASRHSRLLITLGSSWIERSPKLLDGFDFAESCRWWQIDVENGQQHPALPAPTRRLLWPRADWYRNFSRVASLLQRTSEPTFDATSAEIVDLACALRESSNSTIAWEVSQLNNPDDELLIHHLWNLARVVNSSNRCQLLAFDSQPGLVTAQAALMWLTGCSATASYSGTDWSCPTYLSAFQLSDWQREFDGIVLVRNTPSPEPLTPLRSEVTLSESSMAFRDGLHAGRQMVAAVGVEDSGFLIRGDHGATHHLAPAMSSNHQLSGDLPRACRLLTTTLEMALCEKSRL
ncbi:MAG: hypothetical protein KF752_04980 [Pirellulaceae bacterium]|nr:hypothetical protein [Pirellulaceae bacterium]